MLASQLIDVAEGVGLRTDESLLEIGVDDTGTLRCLHPFFEGPGTAFILTGRQEGTQVQDVIGTLDDLIQTAFRNAQLCQKLALFFLVQGAELLFDLRAVSARPYCSLPPHAL